MSPHLFSGVHASNGSLMVSTKSAFVLRLPARLRLMIHKWPISKAFADCKADVELRAAPTCLWGVET